MLRDQKPLLIGTKLKNVKTNHSFVIEEIRMTRCDVDYFLKDLDTDEEHWVFHLWLGKDWELSE